MEIFRKMWSPSAVPLLCKAPRSVLRTGNRRAVWHPSSLQLWMSCAKYQEFFRCLGFGLNHAVRGKKILCFVSGSRGLHLWIGYLDAVLLLSKWKCWFHASRWGCGLNHGANVAFLPGSSGWFVTINAAVPSGLLQERKTLTENVFSEAPNTNIQTLRI